jgi:HAD superfamily hydrolase (TIGR01509 family)
MALAAVVFDFDGLILDTETPEFVAWQELYATFGVSLERRLWVQVIGTHEAQWDPWDHLEELVGQPVDRVALRPVREERHLALIEAEQTRPGVLQWLTEARSLGLRAAVASSSSNAWVTAYLKRLGIEDLFAAVATGDRVPRTKPDPAVYRLALRELGVSAAQAIAVEDSPNGIAAAKAAGLYTVAVPGPMTADLDLSHADLRLASLADKRIAEIVAEAAL